MAGHHNISQTSVYLGASVGGDEDDMQRFEQRIGRVPAMAHRGISDDPNGSDATRPDVQSPETANWRGPHRLPSCGYLHCCRYGR
jgi:hypothetical protein